jgi:dihydrofolate reductase/thymidylate synthase
MARKLEVAVVVCTSQAGGIGIEGKLPWSNPGEMAHFMRVTTQSHGYLGDLPDPFSLSKPDPSEASSRPTNAVIMGRATFFSIPASRRPLKRRLNIVLSNTLAPGEASLPGAVVAPSLEEALDHAERLGCERAFICGGAKVYKEALSSGKVDWVIRSVIRGEYTCDTFLEGFRESEWELALRDLHTDEDFWVGWYRKPRAATLSASSSSSSSTNTTNSSNSNNVPAAAPAPAPAPATPPHGEQQYLDAIKLILDTGVQKSDRTGVGTVSLFGMTMRFNLRHDFPLLTTKRVFWKGVVEELLWFISGKTNGNLLSEKGVKIWEGNGSRAYLDSIGLNHRAVGDLGPVYGFQWRHFGAQYKDFNADYTGQGVDQLADVVRKIKNKPDDRRIILSAWNPADLDKMALPPCHMFAQFYVANGELSCVMYQRSADMGLGVPFNIASYSLLTCMLAQVAGLKPGEFIHVLGDSHVYLNHVAPLREQLTRQPRPFPTLTLNPDVKDIDGFKATDIAIHNYLPHPPIKMEMAV